METVMGWVLIVAGVACILVALVWAIDEFREMNRDDEDD